MKIFIIIILSICAVGVGIAMLVPRNDAHFPDNNPVNIIFNRDTQKLQPELITFSGTLRKKDISIDNMAARELIKIDISKESNDLRLSIVDIIPEDFEPLTFNIILAGGSKKQVILKVSETETLPETDADVVKHDTKDQTEPDAEIKEETSKADAETLKEPEQEEPDAEFRTWPQPQGEIINSHFPRLKDPASFKLANGKIVYGQSRGVKVPFQVYKGKISRRSPACVYEFSDKDPVAEMYALWSLGGRFLLKNGKTTLKLGGENVPIAPEIKDDIQKVDNPLVLETDGNGKKLLDVFCEAMGAPSGSLSIALPEEMWSAVYQTVDKVAVDNDLKGHISRSGSVVKWRLKNHADGYAIIIQESDMHKK